MKLIYVAGPYRSKEGPWGVRENIDRATRAARDLWMLGLAVLCPHANTAWMDGPQPEKDPLTGVAKGPGDEIFLQGDLEMLRRCDGLVLVGEWKKSAGSKNERLLALSLGLPVWEWPYDWAKIEEWALEPQRSSSNANVL